MNFRVGQKVVCIDDSPCAGRVILALNAVYTISKIQPELRFGEHGVFLYEFDPKNTMPGFRATRFRPIIERKTDISIFIRMLTPSPETVT